MNTSEAVVNLMLAGFLFFMAVGMLCATLPWSSYITSLGTCMVVAVSVALLGLLVILFSGRFDIKGL